jgi:hypothetical protein
MIGALTPTGLLIQIAQFFGNPTRQAIRLVPNRTMRLEKAGVFDQNTTAKLWMQGFCPTAHKDEMGPGSSGHCHGWSGK